MTVLELSTVATVMTMTEIQLKTVHKSPEYVKINIHGIFNWTFLNQIGKVLLILDPGDHSISACCLEQYTAHWKLV